MGAEEWRTRGRTDGMDSCEGIRSSLPFTLTRLCGGCAYLFRTFVISDNFNNINKNDNNNKNKVTLTRRMTPEQNF